MVVSCRSRRMEKAKTAKNVLFVPPSQSSYVSITFQAINVVFANNIRHIQERIVGRVHGAIRFLFAEYFLIALGAANMLAVVFSYKPCTTDAQPTALYPVAAIAQNYLLSA